MVPEEASAWLDRETVRLGLVQVTDPSVDGRRWLRIGSDTVPLDALQRPGEWGFVMLDLPSLAGSELTLGSIGFKGYVDFPEAGDAGRRLAAALQRAARAQFHGLTFLITDFSIIRLKHQFSLCYCEIIGLSSTDSELRFRNRLKRSKFEILSNSKMSSSHSEQ